MELKGRNCKRTLENSLRPLLRRFGPARTVLVLTAISVVLSVGISLGIAALLGRLPLEEGLLMAAVAPAVIAPLLALPLLRLIGGLDAAERQLQVLSSIDDLTATYNRRYFFQVIEEAVEEARLRNEVFSIAILDVDDLKAINDHYGHQAGDKTLRMLAQVCRERTRSADVMARYGGDEFVFLLRRTDRQTARVCAQRLLDAVSTKEIRVAGATIHPRVSIGVATLEDQSADVDDVLGRADGALYAAKKAGGDRFVQV